VIAEAKQCDHYPVTPSSKNIRSPRNPAAIKKVDPYAKSEVVNGGSVYSYVCSAAK
jgi:hypothetical protein